jgi:hypothetical protein
MPYIVAEDRKEMDPKIEALSRVIVMPGDLNYAITRLCLNYLEIQKIGNCGRLRYSHLSQVNGVISDVEHELFRRLQGPFEDRKAIENGDLSQFKSLLETA